MAVTINGSGTVEVGGNSTSAAYVRLYEDTDNGTNYIDLIAPASVASNKTITFPDATTTVVGTDATQTLTNKTLTSPTITGASMSSMASSVITSGTAVASTSGTSIDFTSIPSWVKRITVMFNGVSTNGTSLIQVQVGAGSATTTGYTAGVQNSSTFTANSTGFPVANTIAASDTVYGALILELITSNTWVGQGTFLRAAINVNVSSGSVALSGTLDRVRITTVNGTDTFDAGSINILYE